MFASSGPDLRDCYVDLIGTCNTRAEHLEGRVIFLRKRNFAHDDGDDDGEPGRGVPGTRCFQPFQFF